MILRATLLAALGLFAFPASAQTASSETISTTIASQGIQNNGNIGGTGCAVGLPNPSFVFDGFDEMCGAGFLVGFGDGDVVGDAYINDATTGWTPDGGIVAAAGLPAGFDTGFDMAYGNADKNLAVAHSVYATEAVPEMILHAVTLTNTGTGAITGIYPGVFHDWDVGFRGTGTVYEDNVAVRDGSSIYVLDPTGVTNNVLGVSFLSVDLSGWIYFIPYPTAAGQPQDESAMWAGLTTQDAEGNNGQDQRIIQGVGPYDIAAGESISLQFAIGGGSTEADFLANVAAIQAIGTAGESEVETATDALSLPAPNPASGVARVTLSLDAPETVRVTVADVLGRTVATLHDGTLAAGATPLTVDASALAPGVYVVRAEGETFRQTRTLTVAR